MRLSLLFLVLALPVCVCHALLVPPGEVPDEPAHVTRAGALADGVLVGKRQVQDGIARSGFNVQSGLLWVMSDLSSAGNGRTMTRARLQALQDAAWGRREFFGIANTAVYMPLLYSPAATAVMVAKALGFGPLQAVLALRGANALLYLAMGAFALHWATRGRSVLFVVLLLPMSLSLGASGSQDGPLIAVAAVAAAALTRAPAARPFWCGCVLLAVVAAAKPTYLPMGLLLLVLAPSWRAGLVATGLIGSASIGWLAFAQSRAGSSLRTFPAAYTAGPLWPGAATEFAGMDSSAQLRVLLHDPRRFVTIPATSFLNDAEFKVRETVGVLGRLDLPLPDWFYALAYTALVAALLGSLLASPRGAGPSGWVVAAGLAGAAGSVCLVYLSQYITWTPVGAALVEGVQGRYLIPVLLLLAPALPRFMLSGAQAFKTALLAPAVAMAAAGVVVAPAATVLTYYVR